MSSYDGDEEDGYMTTYQQAEYGNSFPSNQPLYGPDDGVDLASGFSNDLKPKVLLMGLRRSGKSSIQNVVFHKMSPNETLFLESTNKITTDDIANTSCVQFKILDFPGQIDFFDPSFDTDTIFGGVGALVFVIDAQDDYIDAVARLGETVSRVYKINPKLKFEVFIHKVDGLTDDTKIETQRDIHQRASDDLHEASVGIPGLENVHLNFYLTSIYDHSIFEAFSKVVQKLIPQLPTLENLLNLFNTNSAIEKSFLFDVSSKIYIATDYSPVDMQSYELCCDMIDVVLDISYIYGLEDDGPDHLSCFDSATYSVIRLDNNTVLLLWEVARYLALVCILREENYYRPGLIEYNYHCFRKGLLEIFEVRNHYQQQEQRRLDQQTRRPRRLPQLSEGKTTNGSGGAVDVTDDCGPDAVLPCTNGVGLMDGAVRHPSAGPHNAAPVATVPTGNSAIGRDGAPMMLRSASESIARVSAAYSDHVGAPPPPRSPSEKYDRNAARHSSYSTGAAGGGTGPVRELLQGHVIRTGGGAGVGEGGGGGPAGHVGNTYVMTADGSMVLVNGGADAGLS